MALINISQMIKGEEVNLVCLVAECIVIQEACRQGGREQKCMCLPRYRKVKDDFFREKK